MKLNILNKTEPENQLKFIFGKVVNMTVNRAIGPNPLKMEIT
jgi:hypothetical protein